jgi:nucleoside-diphosphate kinase
MSQYQRFAFLCEYFDPQASLVRQYQLFFYPEDESIEIYDIKTRRIFLKKIIDPYISSKDIYLNAEINVYSRKLKLVQYADEYTKKCYEEMKTSSFVLILPSAYLSIGKIIDIILQNNFTISKMKMNKLTTSEAEKFIEIHNSNNITINDLSSDLIVGIEVVKKNCVNDFRNLIENEIIKSIKIEGQGIPIISSENEKIANLEINYYFSIRHQPQLSNCSCLILKNHLFTERTLGKVIDIILNEAFEISSMELFYLDKNSAEEFFDVYKGVLPEYGKIIDDVTNGPVVALEVRQDDVVNKIRALVGPHDPEIAKVLRQKSLRAIFGVDRVRNVCHCTDLPEDGVLECQYMFELM